jgi:homogentisate 1,2-dioxygenase
VRFLNFIIFGKIRTPVEMRYTTLGKIPQKRHTIFKSEEGNFYYEQLFGTEGFHGISSSDLKMVCLFCGIFPNVVYLISTGVLIFPNIIKFRNLTP